MDQVKNMDPIAGLTPATKVVLVLAGGGILVVAYSLLAQVIKLIQYFSKASAPSTTASQQKKAKKDAVTAQTAASDSDESAAQSKERGPDMKSLIKQSQKASKSKGTSKEDAACHHPLFMNTLKGHGDTVNGFAWSTDGDQVATACDDMLVRIFDLAGDVSNRDPKFRRVQTPRIPVGVGFGDKTSSIITVMKGTPDAIVAHLTQTQQQGKPAGWEATWQVEKVHGKSEPALTLASVPASMQQGKPGVAVSCSLRKDIKVFNMQGKQLAQLEPGGMGNHSLAVSADGRFIAVAAFASEAKIWELRYSKEGSFDGCSKVMDLSGHKRSVMCVDFAPDAKRAVTASMDGTLRVWNIDVRYKLSEDPKVLLVLPLNLPPGKCYAHLAFGPDDIIAASYEGTIHFINAKSGDLLDSIDAHDGAITHLKWAPRKLRTAQGEMAVLGSSSRDKRVRFWKSPVV